MSNHANARRGDERRSEHGPRYENGDPGAGCNSTHVARGRRKWKRLAVRRDRRVVGAPWHGHWGMRDGARQRP